MRPQIMDFLTRESIGRAKAIIDELQLLLDIDLPDDGSDEGHAAAEIRAALKLVAKEIADRMRGIENNRDLSNEGRAKAFANLASSMRPRIQGLERAILPRLQTKLDALRGELAAPMPALAKGDAVAAIRLWEVRDRLATLDEASRLVALWRAAENADSETLAAFISAPRAFPLADSESLAKAMDSYWRTEKPDTVAAIEATETLTEMLSTNFRSLSHVCDNLSGIIAGDPAEAVSAAKE